jgi:chromosome segregation ATPase
MAAERNAEMAQLREDLQSAESERASLAEALDAARAAAEAALDVASPMFEGGAEDLEDLQEELSFAQTRIRRLRQQRNAARSERDVARNLLEDATTPDEQIDARLSGLREEVAALRTANEDLLEQIARAREAGQAAGTVLNEALVDEVLALKAARASEAAELERIMAELAPALSAGGQNG